MLEAGEQIGSKRKFKEALFSGLPSIRRMSLISGLCDLRDLTPPPDLRFKVRSQNDIMNKIVMGNFDDWKPTF